jgi:hypothetical protein
MPARGGSRYNKNVARKDLKDLDPESPAYWEALLKREGLGMQRGKSKKLSYGHEDRQKDTDDPDFEDYSENGQP